MTQQLRIVFLDELKTIRLVCRSKDCGTIIELPIARLDNNISEGKCPGCGKQFGAGYTDADPLRGLLNSLRAIRYMHERNFEVQFPLDESE